MSDVSDSDHDFYSFEGPVNGDIDLDANPAYYPPIFIAARDGDVQLMRRDGGTHGSTTRTASATARVRVEIRGRLRE